MPVRPPILALVWCAWLAAPATSGLADGAVRAGNLMHGCVDRFDPAADYFPEKVLIEDAANFSVDYRRSYKVVTLRHAPKGSSPERYVLVQCGTPAPALTGPLAGAVTISIPVRTLFVTAPTHVPLLLDLDRLDALTGVPASAVLDSPQVRARLAARQAVEFVGAGLVLDVERVVMSKPSLVMTGSVAAATLAAIRGAGIPVVTNTDWLERTALGRAEWLKYMAAFLNAERTANARYADVKGRYRSIAARAATVPAARRPLVMTGRSTRGTFVIAGGRSYVAALIRDAGGRYVWSDNDAVATAAVDLETQLARAGAADVWINGGGWSSLAAMLEDEPRYAAFTAYRHGRVWVYERRLTVSGGNDYWSRSITRPDLVLADLVKIFHPPLAPEHRFEWYMPVRR